FSDQIVRRRLPPIGEEEWWRGRVTRAVVAVENWIARTRDGTDLDRSVEEDVGFAFTGESAAGERRNEDGERVVSVSVPLQHVQAVLGVLTLEVGGIDRIVAAERLALLPVILVAAGVTAVSSFLLMLFIARPVRRLAFAADQVRRNGPRRAAIPDLSGRKDELGELSVSLAAMTRGLAERIDAIESFAADVAHELKNPLTSIRSAVETLPSARTGEQRERLLAVIRHDVTRLDRLITDISNASRVDAELARARVAPVDLGGFLFELVDLYAAIGDDNRADVTYDGPIGDTRLYVAALEEPLSQVFRNLIDNARTFSAPDATVRVRLRRHVDPDGALYAAAVVEDDGPGVPPENLERIFERFFTERPKGDPFGSHSGLGLAIARQIVEAHGGRIWAENRPGANGAPLGANFHVHLPIQRG
ncbi:MAG: HAMP domain-containing histidine kinase, partial [Caulobacterales bacterium]|nr:HAMP domain-containing histidine kinase [Caulobacterales bacterium]